MKYDVIIVGGGAAGLFCALHAGRRGRSALLLEHNDRAGQKIAVSGGGHCNFTNIHCCPELFLSSNPRFVYAPLNRYTPQDFIRLVERHKIGYYEKKDGQLFCIDSSRQIIHMLLDECRQSRVQIQLNCHIQSIEKHQRFRIKTQQEIYECDSLVIASGGLSIPKIGASDFGLRAARQFGLSIMEMRPALVPLTFSEKDQALWGSLRGASFEAIVRLNRIEFQENVLFTHRGLSGPAILQISSYWKEGETLHFNLLPNVDVQQLLNGRQKDNQLLSSVLSGFLPKRFAQLWCEKCAANKPVKQYSPKELARLQSLLENWPLTPQGTEGYAKAEVSSGGVDTRELSSKTMEAQKVPGLYFIGEVVDVTGHLGGHNFQWAWSSGYSAGLAV
ncbi:MAG: NAD(P)/FAD-dependent oxidoreductase [Candidatus Omnitrophica bacterium]|nr:NAD(P)/FAD-dependent oxidoreductase [Candidatus Omnitrophota bacterium]